MNIGFFTDTYIPQVNGVVVSIDIFKKELERQGHNVYIFAPTAPGYKNGIEEKSKILRFRSLAFVLQPEYRVVIPASLKIFREIPKLKLDIIHSHTPFGLGVLALSVARILNLPLIYTHHTSYSEYIKSYFWDKGKIITPQMIDKIVAFYCNQCQAITAPSSKTKDLLKKSGVKKEISVLSTGIVFQEFQRPSNNIFVKNLTKIRQKYNIPLESKVLIFVGRLAKEKNIEFLIRAAKKIFQKLDNTYLIIVGDGPHKQNLISLTRRLNLTKKVIMTGYLQRSEVVKVYQASDIFVFASQTDTQGIVILEAAASGLPIVAIKDLALENVLIDSVNGYFCEENVGSFSQKVIKILTSTETSKKMSENSEKIAKEFTAVNQTKKLVTLYKNLIKN